MVSKASRRQKEKLMTMICCTLTGVDQNTNPARLEQLAHKFPKAEFGILFSPERSGLQKRFPTFSGIQSMLDAGQLQWAIHLCGRAVPEFIRAAVSQSAEERKCESFRLATHPAVSRIQLNFAFRWAEFSHSELEAAIRSLSIPVITQEHRANAGVSQSIGAPNHQVLFDASGGRGIETTEWLSPIEGKTCGFAGGLGPDTIKTALPAIRTAAAGQPFWIDMESRVRDQNDWFDLDACEKVLNASQKF
jgi:phosphoribosylanthranilate isomerase